KAAGLMPGASMDEVKAQNQSTFDSYNASSEVNKTQPGETADDQKNKSFAKKLMASKSLSFPILTDPTQVFNLLMGEPATLVEYAIPPLEFDFSYTQFFPIAGPLGAAITGNFYALIDFHAIGFDTKGINEFADGGFRNPLVIFDGFYVD